MSLTRLRTSKARLIRVLCVWSGLLLLGIGYALFAVKLGGLPCVFRLVTGWKCPGCGVTHMCLALLRGDWAAAFRENGMVLCMLPVLAALLIHQSVRYVRLGTLRLLPWEEGLTWGLVALLVLFGVGRNLLF